MKHPIHYLYRYNEVTPMTTPEKVEIPHGVWDFHGHICPFMPIGYRMGEVAMRELGVSHIGDHGAFGLSKMGVGHP
jgi:formylmethanofuran dehydrogenase subunit E